MAALKPADGLNVSGFPAFSHEWMINNCSKYGLGRIHLLFSSEKARWRQNLINRMRFLTLEFFSSFMYLI